MIIISSFKNFSIWIIEAITNIRGFDIRMFIKQVTSSTKIIVPVLSDSFNTATVFSLNIFIVNCTFCLSKF